jgi:hypothetical protein
LKIGREWADKCTTLDSVNIKKQAGEGERIVGWPWGPFRPLGISRPFFEQKTTWKFCLMADANYKVELTRYDEFNLTLGPKTRKPVKTNWGMIIYHTRWHSLLGERASAMVGTKSDWGDGLSRFFPKKIGSKREGSTAGFHDFVESVKELVAILNSVVLWPEEKRVA